MSLTYRYINDRHDLRWLVWRREKKAPQWFVEANAVWNPTYESFKHLWNSCEIFGLFNEGGELLACVYLESIGPAAVNIHISVIAEVAERDLVRFFLALKRQKALEGVTEMLGWLLDKNRGMLRVARAATFEPTGLTMLYGSSRGRAMKWIQVRA